MTVIRGASVTVPREVFDEAARAGAVARRGVTAKANPTDSLVSYAVLSAAIPAFEKQLREEIAQETRKTMADMLMGIVIEAEEIRQSHDIAECAGYVEGETGRAEAMDRWMAICEDPAGWLKEKVGGLLGEDADPYYDRFIAGVAFQAYEEGFDDAHGQHAHEDLRLGRRTQAILNRNPYAPEGS